MIRLSPLHSVAFSFIYCVLYTYIFSNHLCFLIQNVQENFSKLLVVELPHQPGRRAETTC